MFAGNCRDSAGVFYNICRENPVMYTDVPCKFCKSVNITGFSLQILQKTPRRVPAIPCKHLQCSWISKTFSLLINMFGGKIILLISPMYRLVLGVLSAIDLSQLCIWLARNSANMLPMHRPALQRVSTYKPWSRKKVKLFLLLLRLAPWWWLTAHWTKKYKNNVQIK